MNCAILVAAGRGTRMGSNVDKLFLEVSGRPVVARDVGAVAETVGDAALLLAGTDPSYVAAAVYRVCTDAPLRQFLVEAGRRRLPAFGLDAVTPQLVSAVASVAGAPR